VSLATHHKVTSYLDFAVELKRNVGKTAKGGEKGDGVKKQRRPGTTTENYDQKKKLQAGRRAKNRKARKRGVCKKSTLSQSIGYRQ